MDRCKKLWKDLNLKFRGKIILTDEQRIIQGSLINNVLDKYLLIASDETFILIMNGLVPLIIYNHSSDN